MRQIATRGARALSRVSGRLIKGRLGRSEGPVPLATFLRIRRKLIGTNPLAPTFAEARASAASLQDPALADLLRGEELGTWALGPRTIDLLGAEILRQKPQLVLELGSGISTVSLAHMMSRLHGSSGGPYVVSIEQSSEMAGKTGRLLERAGLERFAEVHVRELADQTIGDRDTACYDLSDLGELLPGPADFVLVDGPSGPPGVRYGTLPLTLPHCADGARFYLDDALRDDELDIGAAWAGLPGIEIEGIYPFETGLLAGTIRRKP